MDEVARSRVFSVERWSGDRQLTAEDCVVVEEPLEIWLNGNPFSITMRTPGDDEPLALGFLTTEGIIRSFDDVWDVHRCADPEHPEELNIVEVTVNPEQVLDQPVSGRQRYASSACGVCGSATIDAVRKMAEPIRDAPPVSRAVVSSLPQLLRSAQAVFEETGGLHAAGLFTPRGELLHLAEDVGRHNAVDKVVGKALRSGPWPPAETILMVSGRAGFEIVQKALVARIPAVCSVSAPSSLAVELARETGMTLIGFVRDHRMNVYSGAERVEA